MAYETAPTGIANLLKYVKTEGPSRTCSVCGSPMVHLTDSYKTVNKCMSCGYSMVPEGDISGQHKFDMPVSITIVNAIDKKAFFESYQPLDEQLYNALIANGRDPEKAKEEVIMDLGLHGDQREYFDTKLQYLGVG